MVEEPKVNKPVTATTQSENSSSKQTYTKLKTNLSSKFKLSDSFSQMEEVLTKKIEEEKKNQNTEEEFTGYEVNPSIEVDASRFSQALDQYIGKLKSGGRMNLASALENGRYEFEHNKFRFYTENEILKQMLERESDLLPHLRQMTGVNELFWELLIDETQKDNRKNIPYTNEEKLKEMGNKNPSLKKLQEIFKTRIIYD